MANCPVCGDAMDRCDAGHPHYYELAHGPADRRGERLPHWACTNGCHGLVELFDDGSYWEG